MDRSRKSLIGVSCCNNCIHFIPIKENGIKTCKGKCRITGTIKNRVERCEERFVFKGQMKLF